MTSKSKSRNSSTATIGGSHFARNRLRQCTVSYCETMQDTVARLTRVAPGLATVVALLAAVNVASGQRGPLRPKGPQRSVGTLRVGDRAPDFTLKTKDGSREVQLSSFKGKRPVVLIFGSYT